MDEPKTHDAPKMFQYITIDGTIIDPDGLKITEGTPFYPMLPKALRQRAKAIHPQICDLYPRTMKEWLEGFLRDQNPEKEIARWEEIAREVSAAKTPAERREIYHKVLARWPITIGRASDRNRN